MGDLTPADRGYQFQVLVDRVAALEARQSRLEWAHRMNAQKAHITVYSGGSMCTVQFDATGNTTPVGFPYPFYTPTVGHAGYVLDTGVGLLFIPVSSY
jgi:hypothetical protein